MENPRKSAFSQSSQNDLLMCVAPPTRYSTPFVTGGLQHLHQQIKLSRNGKQPDNEGSDNKIYTDDDGSFQPKLGMVALAGRYQFVETIGKGQSSVLIKAKDLFQGEKLVSIKVLNRYYSLHGHGIQEMDCLRRLNQADPFCTSSVVRLYTAFWLTVHCCIVFELLHPTPLRDYFSTTESKSLTLQRTRKVAVQLLLGLGFLQQENVIHADLKPENILLKHDGDFSSLKVVDFGNAIHCIYDELSLYYDDFEIQTPRYRAPEVVFGVPFGMEIDMWSLGCILAELYTGTALFPSKSRSSHIRIMTEILGPLPWELFQRGKFFKKCSHLTVRNPRPKDVPTMLLATLKCTDHSFADFLAGLLKYNPAERLTVAEAAMHPFLAPELALRYLLPAKPGDGKMTYPRVLLDEQTYKTKPHVDGEISKKHLSSIDLLREGSCVGQGCYIPSLTPKATTTRKVAQVVPLNRDLNQETPSTELDRNNGLQADQREVSYRQDVASPSTAGGTRANSSEQIHDPRSPENGLSERSRERQQRSVLSEQSSSQDQLPSEQRKFKCSACRNSALQQTGRCSVHRDCVKQETGSRDFGRTSAVQQTDSRDVGRTSAIHQTDSRDARRASAMEQRDSRNVSSRTSAMQQTDRRDVHRALAMQQTDSRDISRTSAMQHIDSCDVSRTSAMQQTDSRDVGRTSAIHQTDSRDARRASAMEQRDSRNVSSRTSAMQQTDSRDARKASAMQQTDSHDVSRTSALQQTDSRDVHRASAMQQTNGRDVSRTQAMQETDSRDVSRTSAMQQTDSRSVSRTSAMQQTDSCDARRASAMQQTDSRDARRASAMQQTDSRDVVMSIASRGKKQTNNFNRLKNETPDFSVKPIQSSIKTQTPDFSVKPIQSSIKTQTQGSKDVLRIPHSHTSAQRNRDQRNVQRSDEQHYRRKSKDGHLKSPQQSLEISESRHQDGFGSRQQSLQANHDMALKHSHPTKESRHKVKTEIKTEKLSPRSKSKANLLAKQNQLRNIMREIHEEQSKIDQEEEDFESSPEAVLEQWSPESRPRVTEPIPPHSILIAPHKSEPEDNHTYSFSVTGADFTIVDQAPEGKSHIEKSRRRASKDQLRRDPGCEVKPASSLLESHSLGHSQLVHRDSVSAVSKRSRHSSLNSDVSFTSADESSDLASKFIDETFTVSAFTGSDRANNNIPHAKDARFDNKSTATHLQMPKVLPRQSPPVISLQGHKIRRKLNSGMLSSSSSRLHLSSESTDHDHYSEEDSEVRDDDELTSRKGAPKTPPSSAPPSSEDGLDSDWVPSSVDGLDSDWVPSVRPSRKRKNTGTEPDPYTFCEKDEETDDDNDAAVLILSESGRENNNKRASHNASSTSSSENLSQCDMSSRLHVFKTLKGSRSGMDEGNTKRPQSKRLTAQNRTAKREISTQCSGDFASQPPSLPSISALPRDIQLSQSPWTEKCRSPVTSKPSGSNTQKPASCGTLRKKVFNSEGATTSDEEAILSDQSESTTLSPTSRNNSYRPIKNAYKKLDKGMLHDNRKHSNPQQRLDDRVPSKRRTKKARYDSTPQEDTYRQPIRGNSRNHTPSPQAGRKHVVLTPRVRTINRSRSSSSSPTVEDDVLLLL